MIVSQEVLMQHTTVCLVNELSSSNCCCSVSYHRPLGLSLTVSDSLGEDRKQQDGGEPKEGGQVSIAITVILCLCDSSILNIRPSPFSNTGSLSC